MFQDGKLKRHPGVLGRAKVDVALKIVSNTIFFELCLKENGERSTMLLQPRTENVLDFYCLCTSGV